MTTTPLAREANDAVKECAAAANRLKVLSEAAKACLAGKTPTGDPQADLPVPTVNWEKPGGAERLERSLAKKPRDLTLITKLAELHLKNNNPYMARLVVNKGIEVRETAPLLNLLGVATAKLGNPQEALGLFDRALKKDGAYSFARLNKASLLADYGYAKASAAEARKVRGAHDFSSGDPRLIRGAARASRGGE